MANHPDREPSDAGPIYSHAHVYAAAPGQPQPAWTYLGELVASREEWPDAPRVLDVPPLHLAEGTVCRECGTWPCASTCPAQDPP